MTAATTLVMIMVLAFSADRVTKAIMFCLDFIPKWERYFINPDLITNKVQKQRMRNRHLILYTTIVGSIAAITLYFFDEIRILNTLDEEKFRGSSGSGGSLIDTIVTALVVMGGSDLIGRIVAISSIGDVGAGAASGEASDRNKPIEILGRVILENDGSIGRVQLGDTDVVPEPT